MIHSAQSAFGPWAASYTRLPGGWAGNLPCTWCTGAILANASSIPTAAGYLRFSRAAILFDQGIKIERHEAEACIAGHDRLEVGRTVSHVIGDDFDPVRTDRRLAVSAYRSGHREGNDGSSYFLKIRVLLPVEKKLINRASRMTIKIHRSSFRRVTGNPTLKRY